MVQHKKVKYFYYLEILHIIINDIFIIFVNYKLG